MEKEDKRSIWSKKHGALKELQQSLYALAFIIIATIVIIVKFGHLVYNEGVTILGFIIALLVIGSLCRTLWCLFLYIKAALKLYIKNYMYEVVAEINEEKTIKEKENEDSV